MALKPAFCDRNVEAVFDAYEDWARADLLALRALILKTAAEIEDVGPLVETLKWGQPSYLPAKPKTGTTLRIDVLKNTPDQYAMFFHCQTTLVETFRELYGNQLEFQGNRAVIFKKQQPIPTEVVKHCIALTFCYHLKTAAAV